VKSTRFFFLTLFVLVLAARLCHLDILWPEETLPLAAAAQMAHGKVLYRDIWFDKPPLLAWTYLGLGARDGFPLRLAGALYVLLACWIAWRFASDLWGRREALWAAGLLAFYLVFDIPSSVTPLAADLLMLAPHLAAVWLAWRGRAFWSGMLAGITFLVNTKGVFVLAACALWDLRALPLLLAGFAIPNVCALALLWSQSALGAYYEQVWKWGRIYAAGTFVANPWFNGWLRTVHWLGFHAAIVAGALWFLWRDPKADRMRWAAWAAISFAAVAAGWRFFPRYYFQLLPLAVLAAARGFALLGRRRAMAVAALLLVPLIRFGPRYALLARDLITGQPPGWVDIAMDRDSRQAALLARQWSAPGDTLFVWGFRPELYVYTGLPAATRYLDSQPLTGVPADRHLTDSQPVESEATAGRRAELVHTHPTLILDGLGLLNPRLAIGAYADLRPWLAQYQEVGRTDLTVVYKLKTGDRSQETGDRMARSATIVLMPQPRPAARSFRDLMVWRKAHELVLCVYPFTANLPKHETYGLSQQLRRAAVSIPANIAEGFRRRGRADKVRYMNIAEGSLEECRYYLILAQDLGYGDTTSLANRAEEISRLLSAYAAAILTPHS
jgi:four helix bundle protein